MDSFIPVGNMGFNRGAMSVWTFTIAGRKQSRARARDSSIIVFWYPCLNLILDILSSHGLDDGQWRRKTETGLAGEESSEGKSFS